MPGGNHWPSNPKAPPVRIAARLDPRIDAAGVVGGCRGGDAAVGLAGVAHRGGVDEAEQWAGRARQVDHRRDHEGDVAGLLQRVAADRAAGVGGARAREVGCRHDVATGSDIFEQGCVGGSIDLVAVGEDDERKRLGSGARRRRREVDGGDDRAARGGRVTVPRRCSIGSGRQTSAGRARRGTASAGESWWSARESWSAREPSSSIPPHLPRAHGGAPAAVRVARSAGSHVPAPSRCSTILFCSAAASRGQERHGEDCRHDSPSAHAASCHATAPIILRNR